MNRYVNKKLRDSIDRSFNVTHFKILDCISKGSNKFGEIIGADISTTERCINIMIKNGLVKKYDVDFEDRSDKRIRRSLEMTGKGETFLENSYKVMEECDKELSKVWDSAYIDNVSNRSLLITKLKIEGLPELNSYEHLASMVDGLYFKMIKKGSKTK